MKIRSLEELAELKKKAQNDLECREEHMGDEEFTCNECKDAPCCPYVYDLWNTNGDCLAWK